MAIDGVWYNELGSTMTVRLDDAGTMAGAYETAVGSAAGRYALVGAADIGGVESNSLAFCVNWSNDSGDSHSTTAWCGQYQTKPGGEEMITTTWLLTSETAVGDDWESTLIGEDTFTRNPPSKERVAHRLLRAASHPGVKRGSTAPLLR